MKKTIFLLLTVSLLLSCRKDEISCDFKIEVLSGDAEIAGGSICFAGRAGNAVISIVPDDASAVWTASTPSSDIWCNSYSDKRGALNVCVGENLSDSSRTSCLFVRIGGKSRKVPVVQDYLKTLEFSLAENDIDAAAGKVRIPVKTNLAAIDITLSVEEGCTWIVPDTFADGRALFDVQKNPSESEARRARITVTSGMMSSSALVIQAAMSGTAYIVPVNALTFDKYPVYEMFDGDLKIGEICREYLYSYDPAGGSTLVDGVYTVAYPVADGNVNYSRGLVLENGGEVGWNDTGIASYEAGAGAAGAQIYFARGSKGFRTAAVDPEENPLTATLRPVTVTDERNGAADSGGNTSESFTYTVVKIGMQYWMRENLRTTRFIDGTPIPTGFEKEAWSANLSPTLKPMCLVSATSSSNTWVDANKAEAAATRDKYGCLYTYAAVVKQDIDVSQSKAATFDRTDRISPEGWRVPFLSDFRELASYVCPKEYPSLTEMTAEVLPKMLQSGTNQTGFSAIGSRQRGATGGYNAVLYYMTMDYAYEGGSHYVYHFRLRSGDYALTCNVATSSGTYLRLIRR